VVPDGELGRPRPVHRDRFTAGTFTDVEVDQFVSVAGETRPVPDVLVVDTTSSQLIVWPGDANFDGTVLSGAGQLYRFPVRNGGTDLSPFEAIKGDWNADGREDVLVVTTEGYLLYYQGAASPTIFMRPSSRISSPATQRPGAPRARTFFTAAQLVDVTGDTVADLVLADAGDATADQGFNWLTVVQGRSMGPSPVFTDVSGNSVQWHYARPTWTSSARGRSRSSTSTGTR